jgi:ent-kaurene oxidase
LHGDITGLDILLGTHLTFNVTRNKFTPRLSSMVSTFAEEIDFAIKTEIPACKDTWISVDMNTIMTRVISRLTARNWVGKELARTDAWHTANLQTTEQVFITAMILKCLPCILRPVIAPVIPTRWKLKKLVDEVLSYLVPVIEQRFRREQQAEAEGEKSNYEKPEDVIQWMMDEAEGELRDPNNLARRYIYAVIGSLFPVASGLVDLMYDLAAYPEIVEPLRQEVEEVMAEDGGWSKGTAAKLVKMDSFMRESMRVNTPTPSKSSRPAHNYLCICTCTNHVHSGCSQLEANRQRANDSLRRLKLTRRCLRVRCEQGNLRPGDRDLRRFPI